MNRKSIVFKTFLTGFGILAVVLGLLSYLKSTDDRPFQDDLRMGAVVPDFELKNAPGSSEARSDFSLSDFTGKVVLLNFWATWCGSCVIEMPSLIRLKDAYQSAGLELIALSVDESPLIDVPEMLKQHHWSMRAAYETKQAASSYFHVEGLPTTAVISRDGKLMDLIVGEQDWMDEGIQAKVKEWLKR